MSDPPAEPVSPTRNDSRTGRMLLIGALVGLPVGWLLATAAMLPFFLGLFFCLLFGLAVGAAMYRVGAPAAPLSRPRLLCLGLLISLWITAVSLVSEYYNVRGYHLPAYSRQTGFYWHTVGGDISDFVRDTYPDRSFSQEQIGRMRDETRRFYDEQLRLKYPPGGTIGYIRWAVANESLDCPRVLTPSTEPFKPKQGGIKWIVRVILALVFTTGAILSQVLGLAAETRTDAQNTTPPSTDIPPPAHP